MKRWLPILAAAGLCACTSAPQGTSLEDGLRSLIGRPVSEAAARFGDPGTIHPAGSESVYVWTAKQRAPAPTPASKAINASGAALAAAIRGNPNAAAPPPSCMLQLRIDGAGRIKSFRLSGDAARCGPFEQAFAPSER
jgi:hypothetical protein